MKLTELQPTFGRVVTGQGPVPDERGVLVQTMFYSDDQWLTFVCPRCGPPRVIKVVVTQGPPRPEQLDRAWHSDEPVSLDSLSRLTLTPSIGNEGTDRHGPGRGCTAHFNIINGEIVPS